MEQHVEDVDEKIELSNTQVRIDFIWNGLSYAIIHFRSWRCKPNSMRRSRKLKNYRAQTNSLNRRSVLKREDSLVNQFVFFTKLAEASNKQAKSHVRHPQYQGRRNQKERRVYYAIDGRERQTQEKIGSCQ